MNDLEAAIWARRDSLDIKHLYSFYQDNYAMTRVYYQDAAFKGSDLTELRKKLRDGLPTLAGVELRFGDDEGQQSGAKQFSVTLWGEDSEELAVMSAEVKRRLTLLPSVADVSTDLERGAEEVQVRVDPEKARRLGVSPGEVADIMAVTFRGVQLPRVHADNREIDLWVSLQPEDRQTLESLKSLTVGLHDGRGVMESVQFPPGYGWNFGTEIQQAREQQTEMLVNVLLALLCVYMVMASLFESLIHPAVVMFCIPFAGLGVIWLMVATGARKGYRSTRRSWPAGASGSARS